MSVAIACVLLDVGGTLWSDHWNPGVRLDLLRTEQLHAAFPHLSHARVRALDSDLHEEFAQRRQQAIGEKTYVQPTNDVLRSVLGRYRLPTHADTLQTMRLALSITPIGNLAILDGFETLLKRIKGRGLRCVLVSNATWRDGMAYRRDFDALGVGHLVDAIISSVDVGFYKPHRAMFDAALVAGQCPGRMCVMVGNNEVKDIEPALRLGMQTIRVAIDDPMPQMSAAHEVVDSLAAVIATLEKWLNRTPD